MIGQELIQALFHAVLSVTILLYMLQVKRFQTRLILCFLCLLALFIGINQPRLKIIHLNVILTCNIHMYTSITNRACEKLESKLVLLPSCSYIVLAQGHFLLILVNDFVRG